MMKCDPYLNVDPGTMSPYQHGEVYVTDDGAETDLDLGHYERFTHCVTGKSSNITTGKIYGNVIAKERRGDYLGRTVQVIPHITDEIKAAIRAVAGDADVVIVEIGGTVGDIESLPFLEAVRQFRQDVGRDNAIFVHLALVPYIATAHELKTKPMQHSVRELRAIGIHPDILLCRTDRYLSPEIKAKLALFCDVPEEAVITAKDVDSIYEVPLVLSGEGLDGIVLKELGLDSRGRDMDEWERLVQRIKNPTSEVTIGIVGKYVSFEDSYKSLNEALSHGGFAHEVRVVRRWVEAEDLEEGNADAKLAGVDGILVPGGFGTRGTGGHDRGRRVRAADGHAVLRHLLRLPVGGDVVRAPRVRPARRELHRGRPRYRAQDHLQAAGPAGRRGPGRHHAPRLLHLRAHPGLAGRAHLRRHRDPRAAPPPLRVQPEVRSLPVRLGGMVITGKTPDGKFAEIAEVPGHPWYIAVQFHPEFKSQAADAAPAVRRLRAREPRQPEGARRECASPPASRSRPLEGRHRARPSPPRRRRPALPDRGPVRDREPDPSGQGGGAPLGDHGRARHPVRLQGQLRQGEPLERRSPIAGSEWSAGSRSWRA